MNLECTPAKILLYCQLEAGLEILVTVNPHPVLPETVSYTPGILHLDSKWRSAQLAQGDCFKALDCWALERYLEFSSYAKV